MGLFRDKQFEREVRASLARLEKGLLKIGALTSTLKRQGEQIMIDLSGMEFAIEENTTVDNSILALVDQMALKIEELKQGADPAMQARLDELAAALRSRNQVIVEKVKVHTPLEGGGGDTPGGGAAEGGTARRA